MPMATKGLLLYFATNVTVAAVRHHYLERTLVRCAAQLRGIRILTKTGTALEVIVPYTGMVIIAQIRVLTLLATRGRRLSFARSVAAQHLRLGQVQVPSVGQRRGSHIPTKSGIALEAIAPFTRVGIIAQIRALTRMARKDQLLLFAKSVVAPRGLLLLGQAQEMSAVQLPGDPSPTKSGIALEVIARSTRVGIIA